MCTRPRGGSKQGYRCLSGDTRKASWRGGAQSGILRMKRGFPSRHEGKEGGGGVKDV